jgi:outer membrane receptor protein involved in Fe transport
VRLSAYVSQTENAIASVSDGCSVLNVCGQAASLFNINGGTAEVKGVEAALDSHFGVGPGIFRMNLNAAWQDAEFTEVTTAPGAPVLGSAVAQTPEWTWSANFNYRMPLGADATGFLNVLYSAARGGIQDTVTATVPEIPLSDFDNINLRVGVEHQRRTLALFVNNLTDQEVVVLRLQQGTIPLANRYNRPRTIGINLSYRW